MKKEQETILAVFNGTVPLEEYVAITENLAKECLSKGFVWSCSYWTMITEKLKEVNQYKKESMR